jgi:hypothetical protein
VDREDIVTPLSGGPADDPAVPGRAARRPATVWVGLIMMGLISLGFALVGTLLAGVAARGGIGDATAYLVGTSGILAIGGAAALALAVAAHLGHPRAWIGLTLLGGVGVVYELVTVLGGTMTGLAGALWITAALALLWLPASRAWSRDGHRRPEAARSVAVPSEAMPSEAMPSEAMPSEAMPSEAMPSEAMVEHPGPRRSVRAVGLAASAAVLTAAVARVFAASVAGWGTYQSYSAADDESGMGGLLRTAAIAGVLNYLTMAVAGVLVLVWLYRARVNAETISPVPPRLGRGWTVGAWFVPIANLVLVPMVVAEVWRASTARSGRPTGVTTTVTAWWLAVVAAGGFNLAASWSRDLSASGQDKLDSLWTAAVLHTVESALVAGAAALLVLIIAEVCRGQAGSTEAR